MFRFRSLLMTLMIALGFTVSAQAVTIVYTNVWDDFGNFEIYAEVLGGSDGLESFSIDIIPNGLNDHRQDDSPFIQANGSFQPVGFSEPLAVASPTLLFNAQQTLTALPLVGGFGQGASDFTTEGQTTFGAPLDRAQAWGGGVSGALSGFVGPNAMLIASGTYARRPRQQPHHRRERPQRCGRPGLLRRGQPSARRCGRVRVREHPRARVAGSARPGWYHHPASPRRLRR